MKIDNSDKHLQLAGNLSKSSLINTTNDVANKSAGTTDNAGGVSDKVELSGWQAQVNSLKERVKALPDVNEDKVARIQQELKSDTYNVRGELVARGMLKSQFLDEIF